MSFELHSHLYIMHKIALFTRDIKTYFNMARICTRFYKYFMDEETINRCIQKHYTAISTVTTFLGVKHSVNERPALLVYQLNGYRKLKRQVWYHFGLIHRDEKNGPAVIDYAQGLNKYYKYGKLHTENDNKRTISYHQNGILAEYYRNGVLHRDDCKVITKKSRKSGRTVYMRYTHGQLHSDDDNVPAIIYPDGKREHYWHGVLHRENGPAVYWVCQGNHTKINNQYPRMWYLNGKMIKRLRDLGVCSYSRQEHSFYMTDTGKQKCKNCVTYVLWECS